MHLNTALDIKNISTLYKEAHTVSHQADQRVIDNRLVRETNYTHKKLISVQAEKVYLSAYGQITIKGEIPRTTPAFPSSASNVTLIITEQHDHSNPQTVYK